MSKENQEIHIQLAVEGYPNDVSNYVVDKDDENEFLALRRSETEEWTLHCRGEALVDIFSTGNGYLLDIHGDDQIDSMSLNYDTAANLYIALHELYSNPNSGEGKLIIRRFKEA